MTSYITTARPSSAKHSGANTALDNFDPATHPILSRHWFGVEPFRPIGTIAADVVTNPQLRRLIERLYRLGPRVVGEAFAHPGAQHGIQTSVAQTIEHFVELDPETLEAVGGDDFPPLPIHEVER